MKKVTIIMELRILQAETRRLNREIEEHKCGQLTQEVEEAIAITKKRDATIAILEREIEALKQPPIRRDAQWYYRDGQGGYEEGPPDRDGLIDPNCHPKCVNGPSPMVIRSYEGKDGKEGHTTIEPLDPPQVEADERDGQIIDLEQEIADRFREIEKLKRPPGPGPCSQEEIDEWKRAAHDPCPDCGQTECKDFKCNVNPLVDRLRDGEGEA